MWQPYKSSEIVVCPLLFSDGDAARIFAAGSDWVRGIT